MFKVVPDQLRVSDGWVRCGQCDEVFDANANLHTETWGLPVTAAASDEQQAVLDAGSGAALLTKEAPTEAQPLAQSEIEPLDGTEMQRAGPEFQGALTTGSYDDFLERSPQELSRLESSMDDLSVVHQDSLMAPQAKATTDPSTLTTTPRYVQADAPPQAWTAEASLSFLRSPGATSVWHRPLVRVGLSITGLLLTGAFLLQVLVHDRDRIVAQEPAARPSFELLCQVLGCRIEPLRQIESIVIDSSSFSKVRGDIYKLSATLKNVASIEVAIPGLELTLTDMHDQSIVRKVFLAADVGAKSESLAAGDEFSMAVPVSIKGVSGMDRISGYRLVAFYP